MKKKARGQRGSWYARVDDELLPCIHKHWLKGLVYHDPFGRHEGRASEPTIREFVVVVLEKQRVVLTDDIPEFGAHGVVVAFKRTRYIAAYRVEDVSYAPDNGLTFRLAERLHDLE